MKLEVGKSYRTRNGDAVKIKKEYDFDTVYKFEGSNFLTYTRDGANHYGKIRGDDLIEEITSELKLEPGKSYKTCDGRKVVTHEYIPNTIFPMIAGEVDGKCFSWLLDGRYMLDKTSPLDIISEWPMELKLEVGKTYKTSDGRKVTILNHSQENSGSLFVGEVGEYILTWNINEKHMWWWPIGSTSSLDIISEWPEDTEDKYCFFTIGISREEALRNMKEYLKKYPDKPAYLAKATHKFTVKNDIVEERL